MRSSSTERGNEAPLGRRFPIVWFAAPVAFVLLVYVWFISAGLWFPWPKTAVYDYYNSLASAFQTGHLQLLARPSPELLALPDPYRIGARKNVDHIWDATLYRGNYYLYWGPVPALLLIPVRLVLGNADIPDLYLAFTFIVGVFLILSVFLRKIWCSLFADLKPWTLALAIVVAGLAPPLAWMLNRPEVYEAALAAGQLFLLGGLYLAFSGVARAPHTTMRLSFASLCLGLAVGCRASEALPASFIILILLLWISRERTPGAAPGPNTSWMLAIAAPFAAAIVMLLAYNWIRFGSIFEFGYKYQLTLMQMPKHYDELFSASYVLPNLRNYFLNPFTVAVDFPPIRPQYGVSGSGLEIAVPSIYFSEAVTGLAWTFPFMAFILGLLPWRHTAAATEGQSEKGRSRPWRWLLGLVLGVLALESLGTFLFFFATERYLVEITPALALAACMGFWQMLMAAGPSTRRRCWASLAAIMLASVGSLTTALLAISSYQERMRVFNPGLFTFLNNLFYR